MIIQDTTAGFHFVQSETVVFSLTVTACTHKANESLRDEFSYSQTI